MSIKDSFDSIRRDLRHALRGLRCRPMFAFTAVVTIADICFGRPDLRELGMNRSGQAVVIGLGHPEQIGVSVLTVGTLKALNVQPSLGRRFSRDDDQPVAWN